MKDLVRLAIYGGGSIAVILLLLTLYNSGAVSGGMVGMLAILLVVVLPIVLSVVLGNREKNRKLLSEDK